ncbi:MAG: metallophosphoesterase family protein [Peptostreptococcaceae bacterium]
MIIGIISDTHGLLRDEVIKQLYDCNLIIHCGDIGKLDVIERLKQISTVEFIRGNIDKTIDINIAPKNKIIEIMNKRIYIVHNINELDIDLKSERIDIVMYGHSHKSYIGIDDDIMYINPGSVGPRRFKLPISMAKLVILDYDNNMESSIIENNIFAWKCYEVKQITIEL